jgi:putative FmdB family regulatory protein
MPTYEYACKSCGHRFDIVQSFSDDALTTCPDCSQDALRKVFSAAGIIFKGDGWHIKDYGDKKKTSSSATAASGDSGSSDTGSSKKGGDGSSKKGGDGSSTSTKDSKPSKSASESSSSSSSAAASD